MLPRLRFVFAAALIAALPWILLGTGIITTAQNTPVSEQPRAGTGVAVTAGDLRDAHHMHALAYVRRSRELERLRELGDGPLSDWVAAPAGFSSAEPTPPESDSVAAIDKPDMRRDSPPEVTPAAPTVVASLPAPLSPPTQAAETPALAAQEPLTSLPLAAEGEPQTPQIDEVASISVDVPADLSHVDWSKVVPPLPRIRTQAEEQKQVQKRRVRVRRNFAARQAAQQPNPFVTQPNPFVGPPATATTVNPGRNIGFPP